MSVGEGKLTVLFNCCSMLTPSRTRWSRAVGIFARPMTVTIWPAALTVSSLWMDGSQKIILSELFLLLSFIHDADLLSNEHHRRSPNCSFFVFAHPPGKKTKASRAKKTRASKGSRISTQSVATTTSEAPSVDLDDAMDQSIMSHSSTATKKSKKPTKKTKASRTKREDSVDVGSQMEVDSTDYAQPEPPQPKRGTRGKKRASDLVNEDGPDQHDKEAIEQPQPPAKKRATKSRTSAAQHDQHDQEKSTNTVPEEAQTKEEPAPEKPKRKRGRPSKKDASYTGQKVSEVSTNSKTTSKSRVPRDSEIDAALEADLETGIPGAEEHNIKQTSEMSKPRKTSKTPSETAHQPALDAVDNGKDQATFESDQEVLPEVEQPPQKHNHKKATGKRESARSEIEESKDIEMTDARASPANKAADSENNESFMSMEENARDPGQASSKEQEHGATKKGRKKKAATGKGKKSKKAAEVQPDAESGEPEAPQEPETRPSSKEQELQATGEVREQQEEANKEDSSRRSSRRRSSGAPPKTTERYSDIPHEKQFTRSFTETRASNVGNSQENASPEARKIGGMSPLPSESKQQSLSPQSSDAENQPPSTRPSASRLPVLSPSKKQLTQTPTAKIHSPSKQHVNTGGLKTCHPWVPIDIEDILFAGSSDKENAGANGLLNSARGELTSPEKRMTVEEWILWNAKNGEDRLKRECERLVGHFEQEGGRAMRVLEGIECID